MSGITFPPDDGPDFGYVPRGKKQSRLALLRINFRQQMNDLGRKLDEKQQLIRRLLVIIASLVVVLLAVGYMLGGSETVDRHDGLFVVHGVDGANLTRKSRQVECVELRTDKLKDEPFGSQRLQSDAEHALLHNGFPCVCAPMFGLAFRHIAIRGANGTIVHAFNPVVSAVGNKRSILSENQQSFFSEPRENVKNVRSDQIRVSYVTATCAQKALEMRDGYAYCVQICADLLDGVTVYDKSES